MSFKFRSDFSHNNVPHSHLCKVSKICLGVLINRSLFFSSFFFKFRYLSDTPISSTILDFITNSVTMYCHLHKQMFTQRLESNRQSNKYSNDNKQLNLKMKWNSSSSQIAVIQYMYAVSFIYHVRRSPSNILSTVDSPLLLRWTRECHEKLSYVLVRFLKPSHDLQMYDLMTL